MAEDWDLSAVVRGCRSSLLASSTTTCSSKDPPLSLIKQENEAFSFPNLIQPTTNGFQELHQFFKPFIPTTNKTTTISTSDFALAGSSNSSDNKSININNININASSSASAATISYASSNIRHLSASELQRFHDQHVQQLEKQMQIQDQLQLAHQKPQFQIPQQGQIGVGGSSNNNPAMTSTLPNTQQANQPTTRSRKRKSQQKRMVCHVTAENLTSDSWAWRKYGQKPIKGSPYPRNYYRCSSSKGCGARKQVERSNTEPNMFIVTYTGDHTHPRPTHRNSLAGSSRKTLSTLNRQLSSKESMGSPRATVNLSPTTPLTVVANDVKSGDEPIASSPFPEDDDVDLASHDDDDDDILIPNMAAMVDKFLLGGSDGDANSMGGACPNTEPG